MPGKLRLFTKRFLIYTNVVIAFLFIFASWLAPVLDPKKWWFISLLSIAFPFLLVVMIAFLTGWLLVKKKRFFWMCVIVLAGCLKSITVFFSFHFPSKFNYEKKTGTLRIATWNVARFIEMKRNNNKGSQTRLKMMELLKEQNADVICMQEFFESWDSTYYQNIRYITNQLHYPFHYFSYDIDGAVHFTGSIIFSRYPIIDTGMIRYPSPTLPEALLHADIKVNHDTIRIFTTHLQSLQFVKKDYERISEIERVEDSLIQNSRTIFSKLKRGVSYRSIQARMVHQLIKNSPHPLLFCGDLNDVPNSYTYKMVRGDLQDAFLKKGFGIGRTFTALSPTLRIDYIFADKNFRIQQFNRLVRNLSDHYMLVADVELKK